MHLLAIALFGGMLVVSDLRLLGWVMARRPVSQVLGPLAKWKRAGFVVVTVSGLLLAWGEPLKLSRSPSFSIKMALFALVLVHALVFRSVYRDPGRLNERLTPKAKCAAVLSLLIWAGLIVSGRMIGFDS